MESVTNSGSGAGVFSMRMISVQRAEHWRWYGRRLWCAIGGGCRTQEEESIGYGHWCRLRCREVDYLKSVLAAVAGEYSMILTLDVDFVIGGSVKR
jgi:hypothetical protein